MEGLRLQDGEIVAYRCGNLLALAWLAPQKNKSLLMHSTQCTAAEVQVTSRATQKTSSKPVVIDAYNQSMN